MQQRRELYGGYSLLTVKILEGLRKQPRRSKEFEILHRVHEAFPQSAAASFASGADERGAESSRR
jgi:hypothetical protein